MSPISYPARPKASEMPSIVAIKLLFEEDFLITHGSKDGVKK